MKKDINLSNYTITENSFKFVNSGDKIADKKLETKPTTFFKDSIKRFGKNKSSVVAAIILGIIILLAIIVPAVSPYPVKDHVSPAEIFLEPKLFEAGTGFWDGTRKFDKGNILYDEANDAPAGFYKPAVMDMVVDSEPTLINQPSKYGKGGWLMVENQTATTGRVPNPSFKIGPLPKVLVADEIKLEVSMDSKVVADTEAGKYRVYFKAEENDQGVDEIILKDFDEDLGTNYILDISGTFADPEYGIDNLAGTIIFELQNNQDPSVYSSIVLKKATFTAVEPEVDEEQGDGEQGEQGEGSEEEEENKPTVGELFAEFNVTDRQEIQDKPTSVKFTSTPFNATAKDDIKFTIDLGNTQDVLEGKLGKYRIVFYEAGKMGKEGTPHLLKDWSSDYGVQEINLSQMLSDNNKSSLNGSLRFELEPMDGKYSYILIKSISVTYGDKIASGLKTKLDALCFSDATEAVLRTKFYQEGEQKGAANDGYWSCTGRKGVYASQVKYCTFVFDTYANVYDATAMEIAMSDFREYKKAGLCDFDEADIMGTFTILSEKCPVAEIEWVQMNSITGKPLTVHAKGWRYLQMGYDSMPKFILGTDASGIDVFTRMFTGLRTSLVLGVCTFAFCFLFGLCWGSISGYFGGNVDLAMERFCDILGGIPSIVVMTLAILHLGNNFLTFFLALCMTGWMGTAGRTRSQFYRFKRQEYVLAARTLGSNDWRLIFKHILPNSLGTIVTSSVLMIPSVIYSEASLAYLNLGLKGSISYGVMLSSNQSYINSYPYLIVWPSVVMALLMISFNLFGNGLRDAINPTLKGAD